MCQGCVQHFFVHYAYTTDSSTQTDESLCVPFIKGDVHCLTVLGLEVKYKEHKHRDHTAGCRPPGRLPPGRPAAQGAPPPSLLHSDKEPVSSLSAYDMSCVLVLAEKERPPAGPRGLGISASTPTVVHHSSPYRLLSSSITQPPSLKKAGHCPVSWLPPSV